MAFNAKGYLEPGLHQMKVDDIEKEFVTPFPHSSTRKDILDGFKKHSDELQMILNKYMQMIDGSFVTNKNDPGDVDLICFIDGDMLDAMNRADQMKIAALLDGKTTKATHMCDAYFCPSYPDTHPKYHGYRTTRKYWMGEFGYDRSDVAKGIVILEYTAPTPTPAVPSSALSAGP